MPGDLRGFGGGSFRFEARKRRGASRLERAEARNSRCLAPQSLSPDPAISFQMIPCGGLVVGALGSEHPGKGGLLPRRGGLNRGIGLPTAVRSEPPRAEASRVREAVGPGERRWEVQLKGAGLTPYSRQADRATRKALTPLSRPGRLPGRKHARARACRGAHGLRRVTTPSAHPGCVGLPYQRRDKAIVAAFAVGRRRGGPCRRPCDWFASQRSAALRREERRESAPHFAARRRTGGRCCDPPCGSSWPRRPCNRIARERGGGKGLDTRTHRSASE